MMFNPRRIIEEEEGENPLRTPRIMVASVGQHFMPGVRESIMEACLYTKAQGYHVESMVVFDLCVGLEANGVSAMREFAAISALRDDMDYLLLVENDVRFDDKEIIIKLMNAGKHIVAPMLNQQEINGTEWKRLSHPLLYPMQGLVPLHWHVFSCLMFDMLVFERLGVRCFVSAPISNYETFFFTWAATQRVRLWQDTSSLVTLLRNPGPVARGPLGQGTVMSPENPSNPENIGFEMGRKMR